MKEGINIKKLSKDALPLWIGDMDRPAVLSTVSLSRNIKGMKFPHKMSVDERVCVRDMIHNAIAHSSFSKNMSHSLFCDIPAPDRFITFERKHIDQVWVENPEDEQTISLYLSKDEKDRIIVNNGEHIEIFVSRSGLDLNDCLRRAIKILDSLDLEFAYKSPFGFLTSRPAIMTTGIRVEVLLHIPWLLFYEGDKDWIKSLESCDFTVSGLFGLGHQITGNFISIQNRNTHALDEKQTVEKLNLAVKELEKNEKECAETIDVTDKNNAIGRSFGALKYAHKIDFSESFMGMSLIKTGCDCGILESINREKWKKAMKNIMPAHLSVLYGCAPDEDEVTRATMLRETLFSK